MHTIFGMPILTLLFRNFYASLPIELFKAARVDGAGFWRIFFYIMMPMSLPITTVAVILQVTGIWNDFLFGIVFAGRPNWPMTVQLNNIVQTTTGTRLYNVEHGGDDPHGGRAARHLFHFGAMVRARHRRRRGEGLSRWRAFSVRKLGVSFGRLKVLEEPRPRSRARASSSSCSGRRAAASPPCSTPSPGCSTSVAGQIWIGGKNVTWEEPKDRGIGMVFQSYALYPRMTVEGNLTFGLKIARVPQGRDREARREGRRASCRSGRC